MQAGLVVCAISCALSAAAKSIYVFDLAQIVEAVSRATVMLKGMSWLPMAAMPRHSSLQAGS